MLETNLSKMVGSDVNSTHCVAFGTKTPQNTSIIITFALAFSIVLNFHPVSLYFTLTNDDIQNTAKLQSCPLSNPAWPALHKVFLPSVHPTPPPPHLTPQHCQMLPTSDKELQPKVTSLFVQLGAHKQMVTEQKSSVFDLEHTMYVRVLALRNSRKRYLPFIVLPAECFKNMLLLFF